MSLTECDGFNSRDQLNRYVRWMNEGYMACNGTCPVIGNTTRDALRRFSRTVVNFAGTENPFASGNGEIIRLAPAVIAAGDRANAVEYAINRSRTTHASGDCVDAAELLGAILWELREGTDLKDLLENLPDTNERGMAIGRIERGFSGISSATKSRPAAM